MCEKCGVDLPKRNQVSNFIIVGVLTTVIDFGIYFALTQTLSFNYQWSNVISVTTATLFSYWASMRYVFNSRFSKAERLKEVSWFIALSVIGLGLNALLLYLFVQTFAWNPPFSKVIAIIVVTVFNFLSRKIIFEK